jgi:hypothetical protein
MDIPMDIIMDTVTAMVKRMMKMQKNQKQYSVGLKESNQIKRG